MVSDAGHDLFSPAPNSRRAMALCLAMVVAADGRFSKGEESYIAETALPALNRLGDERARARRLKPQSPVTLQEFRLIYAACVAAIGPGGVPDDQFVSKVLGTVTEEEYRAELFSLMLETAVSDGLEPGREAGLLRYSLQAWGLDPARWPQIAMGADA